MANRFHMHANVTANAIYTETLEHDERHVMQHASGRNFTLNLNFRVPEKKEQSNTICACNFHMESRIFWVTTNTLIHGKNWSITLEIKIIDRCSLLRRLGCLHG